MHVKITYVDMLLEQEAAHVWPGQVISLCVIFVWFNLHFYFRISCLFRNLVLLTDMQTMVGGGGGVFFFILKKNGGTTKKNKIFLYK